MAHSRRDVQEGARVVWRGMVVFQLTPTSLRMSPESQHLHMDVGGRVPGTVASEARELDGFSC